MHSIVWCIIWILGEKNGTGLDFYPLEMDVIVKKKKKMSVTPEWSQLVGGEGHLKGVFE